MRSRSTWVVAWSLLAATAALIGVAVVLELLNDRLSAGEWLGGSLLAVFALTCTALGALIAARRPGNAIGWIFCAVGLLQALNFAGDAYAHRAAVLSGGTLPWGEVAAWFTEWNWIPSVALLATFLPLLFPDGRLPSHRWRWVARITGAAIVVTTVTAGIALWPDRHRIALGGQPNEDSVGPLGLILVVCLLGLLFGMLASVAAVILRFRRSKGEERQQLRWFAFAAALLAVGLLVTFSPLGSHVPEPVIFPTILALPIAAGVGVLKYRLYDIDLVLNKTVVYGVLAAFATAIYLAIVVGVGAIVGTAGEPNLFLSIVATAVVALAFQPVRERARHLANRLVYGQRATPYEVLSTFGERLSGGYSADDVLPRMARMLAEATGAVRADVWLVVGAELRPSASWPTSAPQLRALPVSGDLFRAGIDADIAAPVRHQGELLGAITLEKAPAEPATPSDRKLVEDLASQAGLVLRNVRLIGELRASRQRLVAAQDQERRRIERNIHDGAQQQLVALTVRLRLLEQLAPRDPTKTAEMASQLQREAADALEDLRDLARGIYPPLLADQGLPAALEAQSRRSPLPVSVEPDGVGRYPPEVESAIYFCCLEALQNVAKYAHATRVEVRLSAGGGEIAFEVVDDGSGFEPGTARQGSGLLGMADRLDAIGGTLEVRSQPGMGTTVAGRVPV